MKIPLIIVGYNLAFLIALSLGIFFFILHRRIIRQAQFRRLEVVAEKLESEILRALSAKDDRPALKVAQKYKKYPAVLMRVLVDFMNTLTGPAQDRLKLIYAQALRTRVQKDIGSRFIYIQLRAIRPFVMFADQEDFPQIMTLILGKSAVRLAVIDALSNIPQPFVIEQLFHAFAISPDSDLRVYTNVMHGIGKKIESQVEQYLQEPLSKAKLCVLIELAGDLPLPRLYDRILAFIGHPDMEIRIRVARALGQMNIISKEVKEALLLLAADAAWEVQAQALKSIGRLRLASAIGVLQNNLNSPHWYCRRNAAIALSNLGDKGIKRLSRISERSSDRFAQDMARMVLQELDFFSISE